MFLRRRDSAPSAADSPLGPLETSAMEVLWKRGEADVRAVLAQLPQVRAYTTVMTTLDRLFKKGLLERRLRDRAFVYRPKMSREQWRRSFASSLVEKYLANPEGSPALLFSTLLALAPRDPQLLRRLEEEVRARCDALAAEGAGAADDGAAEEPAR